MLGLTRLHEGYMQLLSGLQVLEIYKRDELMCLWEKGFDGIQPLQTSSCLELVSLGEKEKHELPNKLQSLQIEWCINMPWRVDNRWLSKVGVISKFGFPANA